MSSKPAAAQITKTAPHQRDLDDLAGELLGRLIRLGRVAVAVAGEPHESARPAFGQVMLGEQPVDGLALDPWG